PAFPPSIVGVPTAIPAFIGYTEMALVNGQPAYLQPIEIGSMADFEQTFGGAFQPLYDITDVTGNVKDPSKDPYDFSVVDPTTTPDPTTKYYTLTDKSRETISPIITLRVPQFILYNSMKLFYANGGSNCYVVSVGPYSMNGIIGKVSKTDLLNGLEAVKNQFGPTMLVVPEAILLPPTDATKDPWVSSDYSDVVTAMITQASGQLDRVALIDVYGTQYLSNNPTATSTTAAPLTTLAKLVEGTGGFQDAVGDNGLSYGIAYFPMLNTTIEATEITFQNINSGPSFDLLNLILGWAATDGTNPPPAALTAMIAAMTPASANQTPADDLAVEKLNNNLVAAIPLLGTIETIIAGMNGVLPATPAIAGAYTFSDTSKGVWNAPANISLARVTSPAYQVNATDQGTILNMPLNGKAVDAIRTFPGSGTVIWGARTLDGNSNDYRYVQVRRTLIYIEQSVRVALQQFVFAPNVPATWTTVVSMINNFLQNLWSRGGLFGATPKDAFIVTCGLGSTMTAQDILNGFMNVQVVLSLVRPAEFIELTFTQEMAG
ncbi:MAG TPA: phage tail sheath C-terminal domain-containing protein, partial [Thermoanaerobaculia bacterium]